MRLISILLVAALLSGCASYRNRPAKPQPSNNYWHINTQADQAATTESNTNG